MDNIYKQQIKIPCYDTDAAQLLKPVSFMNYAQEWANCHASVLGFGYDDMIRTRMAWVLSRMHIKFLRHPKWRETVNLRTWHKGPKRLLYIRDFRMTDETDTEDLVLATTSWLVVNIDTRRLTRDVPLDDSSICRDDAVSPSCDKIKVPAEVQPILAGNRTVSYSDVDLNGHTNNAMYLVWAMDAVGRDTTFSKPLKEVKINFNHETRPGETVELYLGSCVNGGEEKYWVEGRVAGSAGPSSFVVEMSF